MSSAGVDSTMCIQQRGEGHRRLYYNIDIEVVCEGEEGFIYHHKN